MKSQLKSIAIAGVMTLVIACSSRQQLGRWELAEGILTLVETGPISCRGETKKELILAQKDGSLRQYIIDETHGGYEGSIRLMQSTNGEYVWLLVRHNNRSPERICAVIELSTGKCFGEPDLNAMEVVPDSMKYFPELGRILNVIRAEGGVDVGMVQQSGRGNENGT